MDDLSLLQVLKALSAAAKQSPSTDEKPSQNTDMGVPSDKDTRPMPEDTQPTPTTKADKNYEAYARFVEKHENAVRRKRP